eukprot:gene15810-20950_t
MSHKDTVARILGLSSHEWYQIAIGIQPEKLENSLLTIHKYLQHLFPQKEVCSGWMTKPNGAFDGRRPIDLIIEDGELGLDARLMPIKPSVALLSVNVDEIKRI